MAEPEAEHGIHVLLLPNPSQGHINPILQFGKRLAARRGVRCTLAVTRFVLAQSGAGGVGGGVVHVADVSDGCDRGGFDEAGGVAAYTARLEAAGSETVGALLRSEAALGRPVHAPCAVNVAYGHAWTGLAEAPLLVAGGERPLELPGLPAGLRPRDLPTFMTDPDDRAYLDLLVNQFSGLDEADHVLVNSYELQPQVSSQLISASQIISHFSFSK